jgi:hypothetical protein
MAAMESVHKMADFYPMISKAVAGLAPDAPRENRQALYDRMREALSAALRTTEPPFTEFQIMRERLALEDAVSMVEGEVAEQTAGTGEIGIDVPFMFVSGEVSGRFNPVWRIPSKNLRSTS